MFKSIKEISQSLKEIEKMLKMFIRYYALKEQQSSNKLEKSSSFNKLYKGKK